jgi:hypothetical protein
MEMTAQSVDTETLGSTNAQYELKNHGGYEEEISGSEAMQ